MGSGRIHEHQWSWGFPDGRFSTAVESPNATRSAPLSCSEKTSRGAWAAQPTQTNVAYDATFVSGRGTAVSVFDYVVNHSERVFEIKRSFTLFHYFTPVLLQVGFRSRRVDDSK